MRALSLFIGLIVVSAVASTSSALGVGANARVTRDDTASSYLRYDGSSDATMSACSTGRRSQNEPAVAVDPNNTSVIAAGSNDYCAAIVNGDVWAGYYRSTDGGSSWQDSLVPGYPADTSAGGTASPAHGSCSAAGDPRPPAPMAAAIVATLELELAGPIVGAAHVPPPPRSRRLPMWSL